MSTMLVTVIVPAYKQEKTIKEDIQRIRSVMEKSRFDFEIIVVVDGYIDNTYQQANEIKDDKIHVIGYEKNRGKGYAVRYGIARAQGEYIAFIDAGMDINPEGILRLMEQILINNADIVVGSKRHPDSKVKYYSTMRILYSLGYQILVRILFRLKVHDTQTGLKVYRRKVLEKVLPRLIINGFAFDIELLAVAHHLGFIKIMEAPVDIALKFSTDSKFKKSRPLFFDYNIRKMLIDTFEVFYRINILKFYDDGNKRKWVDDKDLEMRIIAGES